MEHSSDGTITDLGTLVIIDDDQDEDMDTMKSEWQGVLFVGTNFSKKFETANKTIRSVISHTCVLIGASCKQASRSTNFSRLLRWTHEM